MTAAPTDPLDRLLGRVRRRLAWAAFGRTLLWTTAAACVLVAAACTLGWLRPEWLPALLPAAAPVAAVLALAAAAVARRRPDRLDAARAADLHAGTKDLFLTAAELRGDAPQAFAPLVRADAAVRAAGVDPVAAVPFALPGRRAVPAGLAAAGLVGTLFLVPRLDPFGAVSEARAAEAETEKAAAAESAAEKRTAELKATDPDAAVSPEVAAAVERLARDLKRAKPGEAKANRERLAGQRRGLGKLWQRLNAEDLRGLLDEGAGRRTLGDNAAAKERAAWKDQLKAGNADGVREALRQMMATAQEAATETDPGKRGEMLKALRERARDLENFARRDAGNDALAEALKQAGAQLAAAAEQAAAEANGESSPAERRALARQAAEAAKALLEQAELETETLARAARDLAELEKAMAAARQADRLNDLGQLDGQEATDAESLDEFLEVYAEMLAESGVAAVEAREGSVRGEGEGDGEGDGESEGENAGGDGFGEREEFEPGAMEEDPSAKTGYKTERSQSHLVEGKTLLSLKSKGESDRGERTTEYAAGLERLKEGVDEAIVAEDVPPGYHDRIKGYFDSLAADGGE